MTYGYNHYCNGDYRNEGWGFSGSGVSNCYSAWNNDDDTKYASCPGHRGRATVTFPIDISSGSIPNGAIITSVTIWIRVRKTVSDSKSITVNLLSKDDTSKYTSRTLFPTTTIANYEVGTYKTDPVGQSWTKHRINRMMAQVFSYSVPPNDGVRVYKLWAVINYKVPPTVRVNDPTGTVTSASPTVTWTYSQDEGDIQKTGEYGIFTADQHQVTTFNPAVTTPIFSGSVTGDIQSFTLPTSLQPNTYYIYVRVQSVFDAWSTWVGRAFTVQGAAPGAPGGASPGGASFGGIGAGGGGGFESVIADPVTSNAFLTLRDGSNMLSVQQADFETTTDSLGFVPANATIVQDTAKFFNVGSGSLKMTASSAATMTATSSFLEVAPATPVTVRGQFLAAVTGRTVNLNVLFFDANYAALTGTITATGTNATSTWREISASGTTPGVEGDTLYAQVQVQVVSPANAEVHNVDNIGLMYGTDSAWSHGGHMSRNLLSSAASDADDPIAVEPWVASSVVSSYTRATSTGTGAEGLKMFKATYAGLSPTISYVATGAAYTDTTTGTGYTLNKPAGVIDGDVLVAYVAADGSYATPPAGWTAVNRTTSGDGGAGGLELSLTVLMRDGLAADPSNWVGNLDQTAGRRRAVVVAYRGAADTTGQLYAEAIDASVSSQPSIQTQSVYNSDPNAWRLAAFAFRDDVSGGTVVANKNAASVVPPIAYVGRGGNWWYGGAQGSFQVNRPSGAVSGDLMLAYVAFAGTATASAPSGWTQVDRVVKTVGNGDDHSGTSTFYVFSRTAGASEPSSWSSTYTGTGTPLMSQAVAYRNCDVAANQFIARGTSSTSGSYSLNTATVNNTDAQAWRVSAFMFTSPQGDGMSSTEISERADYTTNVGAHPDVTIGVYDSNGPVSTGNHKRQGITDASDPWTMISWIGLLKPLTAAPAVGGNETERHDGTTGAADGQGYLTLGAYDSNGVAETGDSALYGIFTPGSGTSISASACWEGFLLPATVVTAGEVGADLRDYVDVSNVSREVTDRSDGKMTYTVSFLGSTGGTPYLRMYFYSGNELLETKIAQGVAFGTTQWSKSVAVFDVPAGTTRIKCGIAAGDRGVGDYVCFDRVSVSYGTSPVWRRGTGRATQPIFNVPIIEYADDIGEGYGDWKVLPGSGKALLRYDQLTGLVTYIDQTLVPHAHRKYRAKTVSYGLAGDSFSSGYGAESDEVALQAREWWLKDPTDPDSAIQLKVFAEELKVNTANTAAVFQPLGTDRPVVLTEGLKGDSFKIRVQVSGSAAYNTLRSLLNSRKTLFLQSNLDNAWWVRLVGDLPSETKLTGDMWTNPLRFVELSFVEVDPE